MTDEPQVVAGGPGDRGQPVGIEESIERGRVSHGEMVPAVACRLVSDSTRHRPMPAIMNGRAPARYDVAGIGNALVDVIAPSTEEFLVEHGLVKGSMTLVEIDRAAELYSALGTAVEMSGGSAANTVCGVASFGGRAAYIGKVDTDDLGEVFGHDMRAVGVTFRGGGIDHGTPTGRCVIVVTPDAERTMNTYLGVSSLLGVDDLDESVIADASVLYMEGYLFDRAAAKAAFRRAAEVAHAHGRMVSLTLSDSFCVDRHRDDFRALVARQRRPAVRQPRRTAGVVRDRLVRGRHRRLRAECAMAAITDRRGRLRGITEHDVLARAGGARATR